MSQSCKIRLGDFSEVVRIQIPEQRELKKKKKTETGQSVWETRCGNKTRTEQVNGSAGGDFFFCFALFVETWRAEIENFIKGSLSNKTRPVSLEAHLSKSVFD